MKDKLDENLKEIERIKRSLLDVKNFRPGSVNEQFKDPKNMKGSYYQLNYTHKMKTHTEYVKKSLVETIQSETKEYKKFKTLIERWIALSIECSKIRIKNK